MVTGGAIKAVNALLTYLELVSIDQYLSLADPSTYRTIGVSVSKFRYTLSKSVMDWDLDFEPHYMTSHAHSLERVSTL